MQDINERVFLTGYSFFTGFAFAVVILYNIQHYI